MYSLFPLFVLSHSFSLLSLFLTHIEVNEEALLFAKFIRDERDLDPKNWILLVYCFTYGQRQRTGAYIPDAPFIWE